MVIFTLSGKDFKAKYGTEFFTVLTKDPNAPNEPSYKLLDEGIQKFRDLSQENNETPFTIARDILGLTEYGHLFGIVEVPDDSIVNWTDRGFKCDGLILKEVIKDEMGILNIYKKARQAGACLSPTVCANTTRNGYLEIMKWIKENGGAWDSWCCYNAIEEGHDELLKWLIENGCPYTKQIHSEAVKKGLISSNFPSYSSLI